MPIHKIKWSSVLFVLLLAVSWASFGFLLGRSNGNSARVTTEQLQGVSQQVQAGGAIILRGAGAVQRILVK